MVVNIQSEHVARLAGHFMGCGCMMGDGPCRNCATQARRIIRAYVQAWGGRYDEAVRSMFDERECHREHVGAAS